MAAELIVEANAPEWPGFDARGVQEVRDSLIAKTRDDPDFWSVVGVTDLRLYEALAKRQFNDRLSAYREAFATRGGLVGSGERLGRVLLAFASDGARSAGAPLPRAVELLATYASEANDALRQAYGAANLPEHIPPSEANAR